MTLTPVSIALAELPPCRLLNNGTYQVLVHPRGSAFSSYQGWALNDCRVDGVQSEGGMQLYVRDVDSGELSHFDLGRAPQPGDTFDCSADAVTVLIKQDQLQLHITYTLAQAQPLELRQLRLTQLDGRRRSVEVTVFIPLALNEPAAHQAHPAFSKLFVQTALLAESNALIACRRPRGRGDAEPCMLARLDGPGELCWDTDRARFLGRGWSMQRPQGVIEGLTQTQNNVLDPCFALQRRLVVSAVPQTLTLLLGAAASRAQIEQLAAQASTTFKRAPLSQAADLDLILGALYFRLPQLKPTPSLWQAASGHVGQVWAYGMPTDRPFMLVMTALAAEVEWAVETASYWRRQGCSIPVLILGEGVTASHETVVYRALTSVPPKELQVLLAVSGLVCGNLAPAAARSQPSLMTDSVNIIPPMLEQGSALTDTALQFASLQFDDLQFKNGYGGFSADGRSYVIRMQQRSGRMSVPPMPWINVLANPQFGCFVSETGAGCTWSSNSRERRITPWSNDPVRDPHDEAFYLHDDQSGCTWSPLPGPCPSPNPYQVEHGFGFSRFHHHCADLTQIATLFVHERLPVKVWRFALHNHSAQTRTLSLTGYQRLVLGFVPEQAAAFIHTEARPTERLLLARNPLAGEFAHGISFATCISSNPTSWSAGCDRQGFLGEAGDVSKPTGLFSDWSTDATPGNACFVQQLEFSLAPGGSIQISFLLGDAADAQQLASVLSELASDSQLQDALQDTQNRWLERVSGVQVETPSAAINVMLNGWLLYQTLACRMWGRTAFYQSSGAYGFRDQLQDSSAFALTQPEIACSQILRHAARQFVEGDVQHWWHEPPVDRGLRTRFADDLNWLPYLTAHYIQTTGDAAILDRQIPYLTGRVLAAGEDEAYEQAELAAESSSLYEHCCRALDRSLTKGAHGLPLMGTGDWNDGMNRVGREGKGESVWMAFFLYHIIEQFVGYCEQRGDQTRVDAYRAYYEHLRMAVNNGGWDGQWYRRAYYDNGQVLGSALSDECQIDALAQAWAIISKAAPAERAAQALAAMQHQLIDLDGGIIRLLTPPFVNTPNDPGYIKGYVSGVRENGGQYTHAAAWVVRAMAEMQHADQAAALYEMILPVTHGGSAERVERFKTEPYVVAADLYGTPPHVGRGGWSWYTGSSAWLYRVGLESVLGFTLQHGHTVQLKPCIPTSWPGYQLTLRLPQGGLLKLTVSRHESAPETANPNRVASIQLDGQALLPTDGIAVIRLPDLTQKHRLEVLLG